MAHDQQRRRTEESQGLLFFSAFDPRLVSGIAMSTCIRDAVLEHRESPQRAHFSAVGVPHAPAPLAHIAGCEVPLAAPVFSHMLKTWIQRSALGAEDGTLIAAPTLLSDKSLRARPCASP